MLGGAAFFRIEKALDLGDGSCMSRLKSVLAGCVFAGLMGAGAVGSAHEESAPSKDTLVARGKYLVHNVAMCVQCHSPRDGKGKLIPGKELTGARIPVRSPYDNEIWAFRAPHLAGLPGGWTKADVVQLLTTSRSPSGTIPKSPMPNYKMSKEDAQAVAEYLASLTKR